MNTLARHNPVSLNSFESVDRLFNSLFGRYENGRAFSPRVDIREEKDSYLLEAELPGLTGEDVDVKVENNLLTIASKKEEAKEDGNGYIVRERRNREFSRCFVLPRSVNREAIEAQFKNGVLTLTLGKAPEAQPKMIEVAAG